MRISDWSSDVCSSDLRDNYRKARQELEALRPGGAKDLREAFGKSYKLASEAADGRTAGAIAAMDRQDAARAAERVAAERAARDRTRLAAAAKRLAAETAKRAGVFGGGGEAGGRESGAG